MTELPFLDGTAPTRLAGAKSTQQLREKGSEDPAGADGRGHVGAFSDEFDKGRTTDQSQTSEHGGADAADTAEKPTEEGPAFVRTASSLTTPVNMEGARSEADVLPFAPGAPPHGQAVPPSAEFPALPDQDISGSTAQMVPLESRTGKGGGAVPVSGTLDAAVPARSDATAPQTPRTPQHDLSLSPQLAGQRTSEGGDGEVGRITADPGIPNQDQARTRHLEAQYAQTTRGDSMPVPPPARPAFASTTGGAVATGTETVGISTDSGVLAERGVESAFSAAPRHDAMETSLLRSTGAADGARPEAARAPLAQIVDVIRNARDGTVEIALQPEELGRVRLAMSGSDTAIHVQVQSDRPETIELLRRHIALLQEDLRTLGYASVTIGFGANPDGEGPRQDGSAAASNDAGPDPVPPANTAAHGSHSLRLASGGLDLKL